jgi:hypothetical protein
VSEQHEGAEAKQPDRKHSRRLDGAHRDQAKQNNRRGKCKQPQASEPEQQFGSECPFLARVDIEAEGDDAEDDDEQAEPRR